jgi:hypothetical protein
VTICEFFRRITGNFWNRTYDWVIQFLRCFLALTFAAVVIATLTECRPFDHYWQVVPDPGPQCRQGYAQLLTMGTVNIVTDAFLIIFPIPIILRSAMKAVRKFELILLFALSIIPIGVTLYRIPTIIEHQGRQQSRSLWASLEILFATAVTNALVLGSFVRDRGPKKMRFKFGSASDSLSRPSTRKDMGRHDACWGSDEDLVRGLGLTLDPELRRSETTQKCRPAPMAPPGLRPLQTHMPPGAASSQWQFPGDGRSVTGMDMQAADEGRSPGQCSVMTPRKISFFDVGGLLEDVTPRHSASSPYTPDQKRSMESHSDNRSTFSRSANHPPLHDVGGLLSRSSHDAPRFQRLPLQSRPLSPNSPYHRPQTASGPCSDSRAIRQALQSSPCVRQGSTDSEQTLVRSVTPASLRDVGGLLAESPNTGRFPHSPTYVSRPPPSYRPHNEPIHEQPSFQDLGGLLTDGGQRPARDSAASALSIDPNARAVSPLTTLDTHPRLPISVGVLPSPTSTTRYRPDITSHPATYPAIP